MRQYPAGQYGAGDVIVWDRGIWQPHEDPHKAYTAGKLKFTLVGEKLAGDWALVRTRLKGSGDKEQWLLIKENDQQARSISDYDIVQAQPKSVLGGAALGQAKTALPDQLTPQLATLADRAPAGDWHYEIKFDGYRMLARVRAGRVHLLTRNGHDWSDRLPRQVKAIEALKLKDCWLDGEVISLSHDGLPDFQGCSRPLTAVTARTSSTTCSTHRFCTAMTNAAQRCRIGGQRSRRYWMATRARCCAFPRLSRRIIAISSRAPVAWGSKV